MDDENACERCGSTQFELEGGSWVCVNGHDQGRGPATAEDEADFARRGTIIRGKVERGRQKRSRILRGNKAYQLFLQAWQYILWKQSHALVHSQGLPPELWTIVRDLWALRLSKLVDKLGDNAASAENDILGITTATSGAETETTATEGEDELVRSKGSTRITGNPTLVETVALNYMGMLLLRQSLPLSTVFRWVQEETIPFIRAIRYIPAEIKDRLPGEYHRVLDTIKVLERDELQSAIFRTVEMYGASFGMPIPPLNFRPILLSYIESLALPLELWPMAKHLASIAAFNFAYPSSSDSRRSPAAYPEAQLMSLVVVATKLLYPFDSTDVKRYPKSLNDPGTLRLDWNAWLASKQRFDEFSLSDSITKTKHSTELSLTDTDILEMSETQLDGYMDWFQRTWTNPKVGEGINREIIEMFPLKDPPRPHSQERQHSERQREVEQRNVRILEVHSALSHHRCITVDDEASLRLQEKSPVLRPGMRYQQFKTIAILSKTPIAIAFHEEAAAVACLSLNTLVRAVAHTEQRITLWRRARRRAEAFGEEIDLDAEMGIGVDNETVRALEQEMADLGV